MSARAEPQQPGWPGLVERPAREPGTWPKGVWAVLVHGTMDRGAGMAHVARRLRDAATLRYDRRGYGRASTLPVGGLVRQVDDLIEIVGDRPVVLFGHSFGGLVVLGVAATGRLDVRGLATWEAPTPWIGNWPGWDTGASGRDAGAAAEAFMRSAVGSARYDALPARTREARRSEGRALIADMDPVLAGAPPFDPGRVEIPCIFGAGIRAASPYERGARWLARQVDGASTRLVPGATHGAPMNDPDMIAALVRSVAPPTDVVAHTLGDSDAIAV